MITKILFSFFLLTFPVLVHSENIFTFGLDTKVLQTNKVRIQWSANIQNGKFLIYRSEFGPIKSLSDLSNSKLVTIVDIKGEKDQESYRFPPYYDKVEKSGDYYYLVLPELGQVSLDDLLIGINLTIFPVTVNIPMVNSIDEIEDLISNISKLYHDEQFENMLVIINQLKNKIDAKIQEEEPEAIYISAVKLFNAYNENQKKANNNYLNNFLCVSGKITEIGDDYINLDVNEILPQVAEQVASGVNSYKKSKIGWVTCYFSGTDSEILAELETGDCIGPN
ncbi:MAG: hypothetical protein HPY53_03615 [Brevinematales bacterium]|nr:hypothetical protein [Brevinematales bacterium]